MSERDIDVLEAKVEIAQANFIDEMQNRGYGYLIDDDPALGEVKQRLDDIRDDADRAVLSERYNRFRNRLSRYQNARFMREFGRP